MTIDNNESEGSWAPVFHRRHNRMMKTLNLLSVPVNSMSRLPAQTGCSNSDFKYPVDTPWTPITLFLIIIKASDIITAPALMALPLSHFFNHPAAPPPACPKFNGLEHPWLRSSDPPASHSYTQAYKAQHQPPRAFPKSQDEHSPHPDCPARP